MTASFRIIRPGESCTVVDTIACSLVEAARRVLGMPGDYRLESCFTGCQWPKEQLRIIVRGSYELR